MDKGHTRTMKGRLRIAAVVMVCLIAVLALPAFASAATTWMGQYPSNNATIHVAPSIVGVDSFSSAKLNARLAVIKVDNVAKPTFVDQGSTAGRWSVVETLAAGVYRSQWTWTATGDASGTKATVYAYTTGLASGPHTVTVNVVDAAGVAGSTSWTFKLADQPVVVPPVTPAGYDNTLCTSSCHKVGGSAIGLTGNHAKDYITDNAMGPKCVDCHSDGFEPIHGLPNSATDPHATWQLTAAGSESTECVECHGTDPLDVSAAPVAGVSAGEHQGCSCHVYGEGVPANTECVSCHNGAHAPHGFTDGVFYGEGHFAASGHNTAKFGTIGAQEKFDGLSGNIKLLWESHITNASLPATWLVEAGFPFAVRPLGITSVAAGDEGTMTSDWVFPDANVFWDATSDEYSALPTDTLVTDLDKTSVITCEDCHSEFLQASGPHGAATNWGLDANYPGEYSLAELSKFVTSNNAFASATLAGQALYNSTYKQVILKPTYSVPTTLTDWVQQDDPAGAGSGYFTPLTASGIAMRAGVDGDGIYRNSSGKAGTGSSYNVPLDKYDLLLRADGTKGPKAVICAKCHDLENVVVAADGRSSTIGSNVAHNSHHQDATDSSAQCVSCHIGMPHGWKRPRLLVNTDVDVAPYLDPKYTGSTRTNGLTTLYRWNGTTESWDATAVANGGFTRIGMQSLSAVDPHVKLNTLAEMTPGSSKDYWNPSTETTFTGWDTTNQGNMISWSEPACEACNDHGGEDGFRIVEGE